MSRATIVLAEDDPSVLQAVGDSLQDAGYAVLRAASGREALLKLSAGVDLLITDLWMPGIDGLALLARAKADFPLTEVVLITGNATVPSAVAAMKAGAFDYLTKPFTPPDLLDAVERAVERRRMRLELDRWQADPAPPDSRLQQLIGDSPGMRAVYETIRRVAPFKSTVLVTGESGTGKEMVVRAIHELSPRGGGDGGQGGPFIAVNCAAVPAGLLESELFGHERGAFTGAAGRTAGYFEAAHRGTLFIDEIGELDINLQAKLLRALETGTITPVGSPREKPVDVRVIAATNADLQAAVDDKRFRPDLFYRLNVVRIDVPPLRERLEDLPALVQTLLGRLCREHGLAVPSVEPAAVAALQRYPWPGNVRELRNTLESLLILRQKAVLTEADLPPQVRRAGGGGGGGGWGGEAGFIDFDAAEKATLEKALRQARGDRGQAAALLHVSVRTLYRKMARYGLT
jgi:two-component system response regulator HydG